MRRIRGDEALFFLLAAVVFFLVVDFAADDVFEDDEEDCASALGRSEENSPLPTARERTKRINQR
jgi:hypothetical protein